MDPPKYLELDSSSMPGEPSRRDWVASRLAELGQPLPELPPRPERIAVGFDGSARSVNAARWAGALSDTVDLVASLPPDPSHGLGPIEREEAEQWGEGVRARLPEAIRQLTREMQGVRLELHEVDAAPEAGLRSEAQRLGAELLAVGTERKGALDRMVLGSVSETMLLEIEAPTLLARGGPSEGPIVVGVGTGPSTPWAAAWGLRLAEALDRDLVLVHATAEIPAHAGFRGQRGEDAARLEEEPAKDALVGVARTTEAALIVVGHRPDREIGTTAVQVLRSAPCSVLVARPPTR